jgi:hypothetical protein
LLVPLDGFGNLVREVRRKFLTQIGNRIEINPVGNPSE